MIILITGVSGTGKTTVGHLLAVRLRYRFADADGWHSEANVEKMHSGQPLTDDDRAQWLDTLHASMLLWAAQYLDVVLACSALKRAYRQHLIDGIEGHVRIVYLSGSEMLLRRRLAGRTGHFMPASLLETQLDSVEPPTEREAIQCDITQSPEHLVEHIISRLELQANSGSQL